MLKVPKMLSNTISDKSARRILSAYGGEPAAWPTELRAGMLESIARSASLQAAQQEQLALDQVLAGLRHRELQQSGAAEISASAAAATVLSPPIHRA